MHTKDINKRVTIKPNLWKTIVLSLICLFFACVAWNWELKNRIKFKKQCKYKKLSIKELRETLNDGSNLISCRDPFIEHFYSKHKDFGKLNALWVINSSQYWIEKYTTEVERR